MLISLSYILPLIIKYCASSLHLISPNLTADT
uniref:Uncharacterized protein n=1 Tax=Arundo donax TaxID=35708 RepID=A0A0A9G9E7_ARUDO